MPEPEMQDRMDAFARRQYTGIIKSNMKSGPYLFDMRILDYDPESGLFVARAEDFMGAYGITGYAPPVQEGETVDIWFKRTHRSMQTLFFAGELSCKNGDFSARGVYCLDNRDRRILGDWSFENLSTSLPLL